MQQHINVIVFKRRDRGKPKGDGKKSSPYYICQWHDPLTGKPRRKSTKTTSKSEATTIAKKLQVDLNAGRMSDYSTTWAKFRARYETEVARTKSDSSQRAIAYSFNAVEKHINPRFVRMVTADELSQMSAALRDKDGLADASIASILRTLKAALNWAAKLKLIAEAPHVTMPKDAAKKSGGRAVTAEEMERMLEAIPKVLAGDTGEDDVAPKRPLRTAPAAEVESWRRLVIGLWWSGLRLKEALRLHWTDDRHISPILKARRPLFAIQAAANKSRKNQHFPMAPEFAAMLEAVPGDDREGFVFNPLMRAGTRATFVTVSRMVAAFGRKAGVVVSRTAGEEPVYASAHDLRRSFGTRWSRRVLPQVLKDLMRHTSIQTTMDFYITQTAEDSADAAWKAMDAVESGEKVADPSATGRTETLPH